MDIKKYIKIANSLKKRAYAPYSKFNVVALIVLRNLDYVVGVNVENASFGLTMCAERNALFSLISQGFNLEEIEMMIIVGKTLKPIAPCGACLQVMNELLPKNTKIILANYNYDIKETNIESLLPYSFDSFKD